MAPVKKLSNAQQLKKDAEDRKKAIDSMWKACKNDMTKSAEEAITKKGYDVCYAEVQTPGLAATACLAEPAPRYRRKTMATRLCIAPRRSARSG